LLQKEDVIISKSKLVCYYVSWEFSFCLETCEGVFGYYCSSVQIDRWLYSLVSPLCCCCSWSSMRWFFPSWCNRVVWSLTVEILPLFFCVCVCVCVDPDVSFYSRIQLLEICRVRSEKSVSDRKKVSRLADRQTCSAPEREREEFFCFSAARFFLPFSWAAHRSLCFAAEDVIISRRCKLVWS
jgi:hypothetical protein